MKKILFLTTGGTIASSSSEEGLVPSLTSEEILHYLREHHGDIEITCEDLLRLDSSNMQPEEWQLIARRIAEAKSGYDGIVLSHGTDTMAYTAGALSFMLRNLDIPLIMTGSQLPLLHPLVTVWKIFVWHLPLYVRIFKVCMYALTEKLCWQHVLLRFVR